MSVTDLPCSRYGRSLPVWGQGISSNIGVALRTSSCCNISPSGGGRGTTASKGPRSRPARWLPVLAVAGTLLASLTTIDAQTNSEDHCLTREMHGPKSHLTPQRKTAYERRLFVTPDEVARYVFLTNAQNDGDRSAAIYRAPARKGSLTGDYWVTVTAASDSLNEEDSRGITVRRSDAPLPASTAKAVHELWLAIIGRTRVEKDVVCMSPTDIFAVRTASGTRLEAISIWREEGDSCSALIDIADRLIRYPRSPHQADLAREIEKQSHRLLKRVTQGRLKERQRTSQKEGESGKRGVWGRKR